MTWSVYSSPEKEPEPYETLMVSPVSLPVEVFLYFVEPVPTKVLEEPVSMSNWKV